MSSASVTKLCSFSLQESKESSTVKTNSPESIGACSVSDSVSNHFFFSAEFWFCATSALLLGVAIIGAKVFSAFIALSYIEDITSGKVIPASLAAASRAVIKSSPNFFLKASVSVEPPARK